MSIKTYCSLNNVECYGTLQSVISSSKKEILFKIFAYFQVCARSTCQPSTREKYATYKPTELMMNVWHTLVNVALIFYTELFFGVP